MLERTPARSAYSQSLERGLAILSAFRSGRPLLGVSEIGREIGLGRSTTHRYVATLATLGYLQQDAATKKYRLGPRVLDLGFSAINSMELREVAAPHLRRSERRDRLHGQHGDPRRAGHRLRRALPQHAARASARSTSTSTSASRLPAYCTSLGKVLLAWLPPEEQAAALDRVDFAVAGPTRSPHAPPSLRSSTASGPTGSRSTTKSSPTGFARSRRRSSITTERRRRRSTSPCTARWSRWTTSPRGAARPSVDQQRTSRPTSATDPSRTRVAARPRARRPQQAGPTRRPAHR